MNYSVRNISKSKAYEPFTFHTSVCGTSGSGKTVLIKAMYASAPFSVLYINTMKHSIPGSRVTRDNWEDYIFMHANDEPVKIYMQPAMHQKFEPFAEEVMEVIESIRIIQEVLVTKKFFIVIDEIQLYPKELKDQLGELVLIARNFSTFIVTSSTRAQNIPKDIFTQSNMVYSTFHPKDKQYLRRDLKIDWFINVDKFQFVYDPMANSEGEMYVFKMLLGGDTN